MRRPYNGTYSITRPYGVYDPAYSNYPGSVHPGTDYGTPENTPLVAAISGTVTTYARGNQATGRGNEVVITNGSTQVKYCHLNRIDVANGSQVTEGQQVGLCGWTGYVLPKSPAGSHLHFETLVNGVYKNPETMYTNNSAPSAGGNGVAIIQDAPNWYARLNKLHQQVRGRELGQATFKKFVGMDTLKVMEIFSDDKEADQVQAAQAWALANRTAVEKQLADLKVALQNEKNKPPQVVIKEVEKIVEKEVIKEVPVGEEEAVRGFFSKLMDLVFRKG